MARGNVLCRTNVTFQGWEACQMPCGATGGGHVHAPVVMLPSGSGAAIAVQISAGFCQAGTGTAAA